MSTDMDSPEVTEARFQTDNSVSQKAQPRQQLSKGMEHMRLAVTADPIPHPRTSTPPTASTTPQPESQAPAPTSIPPSASTTETPPESDAYGVPASFAPIRNPAARSHSPSNNQKRTDPFAFGSRLLEEGDDIFEFNAWDHVQVDPSYHSFSLSQYEKQRAEPVSDTDRKRYNDNPEKWWNLFYKNNKTNFFKNRKWLSQEFPVLDEVTKEDAPPALVLEVGAGAGNSAFPILQKRKNEGLKIHACDFSKKAVDLIRSHELYDEKYLQADVWDVAASPSSENAGLPPGIKEGTVDVVLMIFIFSALNPNQWDQAVRNIWRVLKPGGQVLFRDYGRGDLAQVRFKKGRYMEENFYVRGDGTRVYFFEKEELEEIWGGKRTHLHNTPQKTTSEEGEENQSAAAETTLAARTASLNLDLDLASNTQTPPQTSEPEREEPAISPEDPLPSFDIAHIGIDRRMLVNRQRRLKMYRCWMQAVFRKPGSESEVATSEIKQDKGPNAGAEEGT